MHFSTLFLLKGESLDTIDTGEIEELFSDRFCYCCGETRPMYQYWCDWFQIGGRWCDIIKATRGIHCTRDYPNVGEPVINGEYSVIEVKDLVEPIEEDRIYAIATKSRIYMKPDDKFDKLLNDINTKKFVGVIALIDCHD